MSIRETNNKAKEIIISCLNEVLKDENKNCEGSNQEDCNPELIAALEKQIERVRLALYYK